MATTNGSAGYNRGAIFLHWTIAWLVLFNVLVGTTHESLSRPLMGLLMGWHKAVGITILVLSVARLAWRLMHRPPALPPMPRWQVGAAHALHWLFYFLIIAMPLSGWWMSSAGEKRQAIDFFGLFDVPFLPVTRGAAGAGEAFHEFHEIFGWALVPLLLLHIGAALWHHFANRDTVLVRMLPGSAKGRG
jgi:cytochrome b561